MQNNTNLHLPQYAKRFKQKYLQALKENKESFDFRGQEVIVSYAKYVVEHLETSVFKEKLEKLK